MWQNKSILYKWKCLYILASIFKVSWGACPPDPLVTAWWNTSLPKRLVPPSKIPRSPPSLLPEVCNSILKAPALSLQLCEFLINIPIVKRRVYKHR